jgi:hypothetical protein
LPKKVGFFDSPLSMLLFLAGFFFGSPVAIIVIELRNRFHQFFGFSLGNSSQ